MEQRKICPACTKKHGFTVWLPVSSFGINASKADGLASWCKRCNRDHIYAHRDHHKRAKAKALDLPPREDKRWRGPVGEVLQRVRIRGARLWQS
jgi:hypothetical protein